MAGRVLVTFDVDGTLMQNSGITANRMHRRAFSHAFNRVFGIDGTIDAIQHHGQTDPAIIVNTLVHYGVSRDIAIQKLPEIKSNMIQFAKDNANEIGDGLELLPGVSSLLESLTVHKDVVVGLVTGNLEEIAWMKMDGLGIRKYFTLPNFGGFGSDHDDRGQLVKIAAERADKLFPGGFRLHVHVGDTPNDIQAAEFGGALPIGVCTGAFKKEDLEKASSGNAYLFDNLTDSQKFLGLLGI